MILDYAHTDLTALIATREPARLTRKEARRKRYIRRCAKFNTTAKVR
jgi:hypothetical protein